MIRSKNTKNNFEDVYLRTSYLVKSQVKVTDQEFLKLYPVFALTIKTLGPKFYSVNSGIFKSAGFEIEDLISFAKIQLWVFLSGYSMLNNDERLQKFKEKRAVNGKYSNSEIQLSDITRKDNSNFMNFLNQRLYSMLRVCTQKSRNIKGIKEVSEVYEKMPNAQAVDSNCIPYDPALYGYRKLSANEIRVLKKDTGLRFNLESFSSQNKNYIKVSSRPSLSREALEDLPITPKDSLFYQQPDDAIAMKERLSLENLISQDNNYKIINRSSKHGSDWAAKPFKQIRKKLPKENKEDKILLSKAILEINGD